MKGRKAPNMSGHHVHMGRRYHVGVYAPFKGMGEATLLWILVTSGEGEGRGVVGAAEHNG